jgi:hypothetical protein
VTSTWPDGSAQTIDVDFNISLAPAESRTWLTYGPDARLVAPRASRS